MYLILLLLQSILLIHLLSEIGLFTALLYFMFIGLYLKSYFKSYVLWFSLYVPEH